MRMCRVPAVIVAAVICGAGLSACGASGSNPAADGSAATNGSAAALASTPGASPTSALTGTPTSSPTPADSPTQVRSTAAKPSATASTRPKSSPRATSSPTNTSSGTHNFTVPSIPGDNVVSAYGSYAKIGTARVKVTMCAKQTGTAFSVGAIALVYSASGSSQNIGATILTGPGNSTCVSNTFILYTAHLKVHAFIGGSNGTIVKTGPVLTLY
jgi:hypothetical protein